MKVISVAVTTDGSGDFSAKLWAATGELLQWRYVPDGSSPLDTGADVTLVGDTTGLTVVNVTNLGTSALTKAPRQPTHDLTGAASLYAAAGEPVEAPYVLGGEAYTLTVAQGGAAKSGTFYFWLRK